MKRGIALVFLLTVFPFLARAAEYGYDQGKSRVGFTLKHLGVVTVEGHFKIFSGTFRFDLQDIQSSRVNISIESASVESGNPGRDRHLRSEKFFASAQHPLILFVSKKFEALGENHYAVHGDLTIRGITHPTVFEAELLPVSESQPKTGRISFHARTFIHRKDYHLGTGRWHDPIMLITDESLKISLAIEGIPVSS